MRDFGRRMRDAGYRRREGGRGQEAKAIQYRQQLARLVTGGTRIIHT